MSSSTPADAGQPIIPPHEWRHGDEVLIVKCVDRDGRACSGFQHPMTVGETVEAPDWTPMNECGGGIHGWPWGLGLGDGKEPDYRDGLWLVYGVKADIVGKLEGGSKCKFRAGTLRYAGQWVGALAFTLAGRLAWIEHAARGAASATGDSGAASADGLCTAAMVTGLFGRAKAGEFGCIALAWWNAKESRAEMRCACTGAGQALKADTWYTLDDAGEFTEVQL
jgi:hypothetical protein